MENLILTLLLKPRTIALFFAAVTGMLLTANIIGILAHHRLWLFDMDAEENLPTFFSSVLLLISSGLLACIARAKQKQQQRDHPYWTGLAVIFLYLSIDEFAEIHEKLTEPITRSSHTSGLLYYAWVIPYGILTLLIVFIYARFLFKLTPRIRTRFLLAGALFLAGAIGIEMIEGYWHELHGEENIIYLLLVSLEETLEMFGIIVFIHALASFISSELKGINLRIGA